MSVIFGHRHTHKHSILLYADDRPETVPAAVTRSLKARGKVRLKADILRDPDVDDFRGLNTKGWKAHKHAHQWEHNIIEAEKHEKNRRRKAEKRACP